MRAIRPEDEPLIEAQHRALSEQSIRMRFFSMVKALSRDSLIRLCHLDYAREMALVAERKNAEGKPEIIGVSRYYMNPQTRSAEFAVIVRDAYQGAGAGPALDGTADRRGPRARRPSAQRRRVARERTHAGPGKGLGFREGEGKTVDHDAVQMLLDL